MRAADIPSYLGEVLTYDAHFLANMLIQLRAGQECETLDDHFAVLRESEVPEHPEMLDALFNLSRAKACA